jgi:hypothetical protein
MTSPEGLPEVGFLVGRFPFINTPRDAGASEGPTGKDSPLPATPTLTDDAPTICGGCECPVAPYRWVNPTFPTFGRQCECVTPLDPIEIDRSHLHLFERDASPSSSGGLEPVLANVDEALSILMEARKAVDTLGERILHVHLGLTVDQLLDCRTEITERTSS